MTTSLKVLTCGDIEGRWTTFLKRIQTVNKKAGPFDMILCVGSAFSSSTSTSWDEIRSGRIQVPVPIYLLGPNRPEEIPFYDDLEGCELAPNVIYLGRNGCYDTKEGLKIVYLSGTESSGEKTGLSYKDLKNLEVKLGWNDSDYVGIDILLTSEWPHGICNYAAQPQDLDPNVGSKLISKLAVHSKPRYHFTGLHNCHYERSPYRNHKVINEKTRHVTRFVALAQVGNEQKRKWIYAFNVVPLTKMERTELLKQPCDVTDIPFQPSNLIGRNVDDDRRQFFFDMNSKDDNRKRKPRHDQPHPPQKLKDSCWFCLSSEEVEKHLVVSVGDHSYLALPKGGLTRDHVLILPIAHYASTLDLPEDVAEEIRKFKDALNRCFESQGKAVIYYERFYRCYHLQLQCVPVPKDLKEKVPQAFLDAKDVCGVELEKMPQHSSLTQTVESGKPFFHVEIPGIVQLYHRVRSGFNINFGRDVLASPDILNLPDRVDWRKCKVDKDEETRLTKDFRTLFEPYDFTLE